MSLQGGVGAGVRVHRFICSEEEANNFICPSETDCRPQCPPFIFKSTMDKYNVIEKIHKTVNSTYYSALHKHQSKKVVLQKRRPSTQPLTTIRNAQFCPRILDLFEEEAFHFTVFQELGVSLSSAIAHHNIGNRLKYNLLKALVDIMVSLYERGVPIHSIHPGIFFIRPDRTLILELPSFQQPKFIRYESPERMRGWLTDSALIFSLGCILAEIVIEDRLFTATTPQQYFDQYRRLFLEGGKDSFKNRMQESGLRKEDQNLISMMLLPPSQRITYEELGYRWGIRHAIPDFKYHNMLSKSISKPKRRRRSPKKRVIESFVREAREGVGVGVGRRKNYSLHGNSRKMQFQGESRRMNDYSGKMQNSSRSADKARQYCHQKYQGMMVTRPNQSQIIHFPSLIIR